MHLHDLQEDAETQVVTAPKLEKLWKEKLRNHVRHRKNSQESGS